MSLSKTPAIPARSGYAAPGEIEERMGPADGTTAADLHARYLGDVFRYVLRRVPRREEAEDITAEVFAAAIAGLAQFRGQCSPYVWLLGIARRQIAIALRRRTGRREMLT